MHIRLSTSLIMRAMLSGQLCRTDQVRSYGENKDGKRWTVKNSECY